MNAPPLLVGCALLFWGWQTGMLIVAIPAALVLEASRWINWRLELEQDHYTRLWNLSVLFAIGFGFFLFFSQGGYAAVNEFVARGQNGVGPESLKSVGNLVLRLVQLLPATLLLFMTAFAYGPLRELPASTYSLIYRRRIRRAAKPGARPFTDIRFNPTYAFLILLLLAVAATATNSRWFFPILAILIIWTIWSRRPDSYRPWIPVTAMIVAIGLGFLTQVGLLYLQQQLEAWQNRLMNTMGGAAEFDTSQTRTSMGQLGQLKQSGHIVWRIQPAQESPPSLLLEAAFNLYQQPATTNSHGRFGGPSWTTRLRKFEYSDDGNRDPTWVLNSLAAPTRSITLIGYTRNGEVNIPHPEGTVLVTDATASILAVQTNMLGAMRAIGGQTLAVLETRYGSNGGFAVGPYDDDLSLDNLAPADVRALKLVAAQLKLANAQPEAALGLIRLYFFNNFDYTLDLSAPPTSATNNTPLSNFLLERHQGHCEYFATATTLLLRAAGIPARYAVGYSVQEKRSGNEYVVRDRHAHAWALAWINHRWVEVDNTPASWFEKEWSKASPWEAQLDWWSDAWLAFYRWRQGDGSLRLYVLIAAVLALGFLAWRQVAGKRWRKVRGAGAGAAAFARQGLDSEFFLVEKEIEKRYPRDAAEPVGIWLSRLPTPDADLARQLSQLVDLHYRYRFDPAGLAPAERQRLRDESKSWLRVYLRKHPA